MNLPASFQFSQGSLQDYVDCARRFQLRYVRRLRWPAVEAGPALESERYLQQGAAFHRLVRQHLIGLPVKRLSGTLTDPDLRRWWRNYLESGPPDLPSQHHPEVGISASVAGFRLAAQYDLVAVDAGKLAVIVDWKTSRKLPGRESLSGRLQTRVYPYLLVRAGSILNEGQEIQPHQVSMIYWFANYPARPERFDYDSEQFQADHELLTGLIVEIQEVVEGREDRLLPRTEGLRRCRYCRYRSLCDRGIEAGLLGEPSAEGLTEDVSELELGFEFDFEQIGEADYG